MNAVNSGNDRNLHIVSFGLAWRGEDNGDLGNGVCIVQNDHVSSALSWRWAAIERSHGDGDDERHRGRD